MFTRVTTGVVAAGLLLVAQSAAAGNHRGWDRYARAERDPGYDYARVIDVEPLVSRVRVSVPRRECYVETRYEESYPAPRAEPPRGAAGQMILGSVIGAAVGNQIGRGDGRRAATVAGAIIGAAIGHDAAARGAGREPVRYGGYDPEPRSYPVERCDTRYVESWEERVDAYRVTYEYYGRRYATQLPYDPGERIRVRVDVQPD